MTDCTFTEDDARWMREALDLAHHSWTQLLGAREYFIPAVELKGFFL